MHSHVSSSQAHHHQVTSDPASNQKTTESSGPIASDSLAAESVNAGGAFSDNANSTPSSVPGSKSTFANTDTSAATTLDPTPDAAGREEKSAWSETADLRGSAGGVKYAEGLGGQPEFSGSTGPSGYAGGPSGSASTTGSSGPSSSGATNTGYSSGAPSSSAGNAGYSSGSAGADTSREVGAGSSYGLSAGEGKPKGQNLQEGGFEGEAANVSDQPAEIGSENDPGRAAVQAFQTKDSAAYSGAGPREGVQEKGTGGYEALGSEEQA